jgi:hypothetical protein
MDNSEKNITEEIIDQLIIKVSELEKREFTVPDYTPQFEALQHGYEAGMLRHDKEVEEFKAVLGQLKVNYPAEQIKNNITDVKGILATIQKSLPIKHKHQFDFNTKGWIISGMILLIVAAISTALSAHLWVENSNLNAVNTKYRMIRQVYPYATSWADSVYTKSPADAEAATTKLENGVVKETKATKTHKRIRR